MTPLPHPLAGPAARLAVLADRLAGGLTSRLRGLGAGTRARLSPAGRDRGDVPGWVLVTIMTAALVTALMYVAEPKLRELFVTAVDGVTRP